jgi:hypothetical protein
MFLSICFARVHRLEQLKAPRPAQGQRHPVACASRQDLYSGEPSFCFHQRRCFTLPTYGTYAGIHTSVNHIIEIYAETINKLLLQLSRMVGSVRVVRPDIVFRVILNPDRGGSISTAASHPRPSDNIEMFIIQTMYSRIGKKTKKRLTVHYGLEWSASVLVLCSRSSQEMLPLQ